jgi:hypothetical protein
MRRKRSSRDVDTMRRVAENSKATVSRKKRRTIKQQVSWSTAEPSIRVQLDSSLLFPDYDEGDVWYTVGPDFDDPFSTSTRFHPPVKLTCISASANITEKKLSRILDGLCGIC